MLNECDSKYDMSVNDTGRVWQSNLSNTITTNVSVLSEMIDIRNGFKRCQILYDKDVNSIITDISVF